MAAHARRRGGARKAVPLPPAPAAPGARGPLASDGRPARELVLARIRAAVAGAEPPGEQPRAYRTEDSRSREEVVALFAERVAEYRATVQRTDDDAGVAALVSGICAEHGARRLGVASGAPARWRPEGFELVEDEALSTAELDTLDGALTGCAVAIAETGSFVLDGGPGQGRRALSLVPDLHVCVVRASRSSASSPRRLSGSRSVAPGQPAHVCPAPRPPPTSS